MKELKPVYFDLHGVIVHSPVIERGVDNRLPGWEGDESNGHPKDRMNEPPAVESIEAALRRTPELAPPFFQHREDPI